MAQRDKQLKSASSLLDFEATNYFKLDPSQLQMFGQRSKWINENTIGFDCADLQSSHKNQRRRTNYNQANVESVSRINFLEDRTSKQTISMTKKRETTKQEVARIHSKNESNSANPMAPQKGYPGSCSPKRRKQTRCGPNIDTSRNDLNSIRLERSKHLTKEYEKHSENIKADRAQVNRFRDSRRVSLRHRNELKTPSEYLNCSETKSIAPVHQQFVSSSTASTNSLPSISSSPSVSPSLVCPHMSLDDLLGSRSEVDDLKKHKMEQKRSPHTIGLCAKCRTNAPPNAHSPLSPMYRPSKRSYTNEASSEQAASSNSKRSDPNIHKTYLSEPISLASSLSSLPTVTVNNNPSAKLVNQTQMKRGYSDGTQVGAYVKKSRARYLSSGNEQRDDSLDCCLDPGDLRRMQLSPTLRHSVEFIRNNSIESARVVKVFKNGEPFEKPLRVCITRGEFSSLDHLLDHINSRQLIAFGARYLFHLDGQLVYSVHELKHKKAYIVSGVRQYDYRAASIIKERLKQEEEQAEAWLNSHPMHRHLHRRNKQVSDQNRCSHSQPEVEEISPLNSLRGASRSIALPIGVSANSIDIERDLERDEKCKHKMVQKMQPVRYRVSQRSQNGKAMNNASRSGSGIKSQSEKLVEEHNGRKHISPNKSMARIDAANERKHLKVNDRYDSMEVFFDGDENDNLDQERTTVTRTIKQPIITRAKSEMSGLPPKRKKNVTFIDTGRGSSPTINTSETARDHTEGSANNGASSVHSTRQPNLKALNTSEIGIQVSDSLEGHLIDLPIPLPDISGRGRKTARTGIGRRTRGQRGGVSQAPGKIVAFSERQLSLDELSQLTDLDRGDHHNKSKHVEVPSKVMIHIEPDLTSLIDEEGANINDTKASIDNSSKSQQSLDTKTNVTTSSSLNKEDAGPEDNDGAGNVSLALHSLDTNLAGDETIQMKDDQTDKSDWQYPGGRKSSAAPIERSVSQNEASESVRARVTTPTPSLSTCGDNNSLTMSYESPVVLHVENGSEAASPSLPSKTNRNLPKAEQHEFPPKQVIEVRGDLCSGVDPPVRNFKLQWVNGFTINDRYPDNSITSASKIRAGDSMSPTPNNSPTLPDNGAPTQGLKLLAPNQINSKSSPIDFKPSERFHNWICHSRLHDELIYPAGTLIVLWSRWTDTQRYYSKHTANVSCISLASLDLDLAASAQLGESVDRVQPVIHLWSLTSLTTLLIFGEDQFKGRRIISLRLRHSTSSGCDICVAARDDKYLWLYAIHLDSEDVRPSKQVAKQVVDKILTGANERKSKNSSSMSILKINKALQGSQVPLLLTNLAEEARTIIKTNSEAPKAADEERLVKKQKLKQTTANEKATEIAANQKGNDNNDLLLSFGRRHFQVWSVDKRQNILKALQSDKKGAKFVDMVAKSNCLARLSPSEFLLGDSNGNIALITIQLNSQISSTSSKIISGLTRSSSGKLQKYSVDAVHLVGRACESERTKEGTDCFSSEKGADPIAVTCLARVSGNLFASGDSNCTVRFWKLQRSKDADTNQLITVGCRQVSCVSLPTDLGFICTLLSANYDRKRATVEFYVVSTSNAILFGHVKLATLSQVDSTDMLASSSLSVVYEGHETSVSGLVADIHLEQPLGRDRMSPISRDAIYFTCSLDCKVCKWNRNRLVWKSMLPSACASIAVHPIGSVLAVGSIDGTVYILDKLSGLLISYFPLTPVRINCLGYAQDGSLLAAGCLNGSIFMLPVYERGLKYKKVSIFQSPYPVVSLQFSSDNRYILTSVTHGSYQELILWDLPNFRYMRDNVKLAADKIEWFDSICSGSEDVRATWENANIEASAQMEIADGSSSANSRKLMRSSVSLSKPNEPISKTPVTVINLSCHRLILNSISKKSTDSAISNGVKNSEANFVIASDTRGYLRLFRYPCYNIDQGFYVIRASSEPMNCCRFLAKTNSQINDAAAKKDEELCFVTTSRDGSICIWSLD